MQRSVFFPPAMIPMVCLISCRTESPETQVKRALDECLKAIEAGDADPVIDRLSLKFQGPEGMDRASARLFLMMRLRREKIGVTLLSQKVNVQDEEATQNLDVMLTSRTGKSVLPDESSRKTFILRWEHKDGKWLLREAQQVGGT